MAKLSELKERIEEAIEKFGDREYVLTAVYGAVGDVCEIMLYEEKYYEGVVCITTDLMTG